MRPAMSALVLAILLVGCSGGEGADTSPAASGSAAPMASAAPTPAASVAAPAAVARSVEESNPLYEFEFSYPAAAAAVPALKAVLDAQLEEERRGVAQNARQARADAKKEGFPFNPYGSWTAWSVVTNLPDWLSLSAEVSSYEGGAHPNHGYAALLWDRKANKQREALDLFTSKAALSGVIRQDFCRLLDRERAKKRGAPVRRGSDEPFSDCIDPVESTVILGSAGGKAFDRIGVLIGPYEAGPYVEGGYEVTLPVTAAVLAVVKPEYRASFAAGR